MIASTTARQNPFPGLRPFREDESHLFFGRENQVDTMVNKLAATRFLAVVGTSGSGKSSLVNCGLRPALHRGLMASAGPAWRMAQFRPGSDPIQSLAQALAAEGVLFSGYKEDFPIAEIVETYLRQSASGVVDAFRKARLPEGTNLLVVADQFEELFRYGKLESADGKDPGAASENAIAFVNLLLQARTQPDCPIYVVITMRSDFLGDSSQFYGLPEAINQGQYLVPRMTRDERRASIAGPVSVGGAEIDPVLLTRLVNDVGDNPDQLSILQHALNRTWACWESHGAEGELKLDHYTEIGTMGEALNQHANEAFAVLGTPERIRICEKLFRALTDLGTDPRGIRRPLKLATLTEIAAADSGEDELKTVIEVFRDPSRAFLMPPATEALEPHKVIDISHESLMRVWKRLRGWAEEESNSARRYRRLAETATLEKAGNAALWTDPDLQLALDWKEEHAPTPAWSNLYGGGFECAMAFLEKSRSERDHELAEEIFERRWRRVRRWIIAVLVIIFVSKFKHFQWWLGWWEYDEGLRSGGWKNIDFDWIWNKTKLLLALTCFLGPYFLGYTAVAYFAKRTFRRLAFGKILQEVALSSSKAVRDQKLAQYALGDAAVALQTTYASFWRRLGAYVLDSGVLLTWLVALLVALIYGITHGYPKLEEDIVVGSLLFVLFAIHWVFHAMMLSSHRQASLGMLALRIFVTNQNGDRLSFGRATRRHFTKMLSYLTLGVGFLVQLKTPKRQTLHDRISGTVVLDRTDKKEVSPFLIAVCITLGLTEALLAGLLVLGMFVNAE